MLRLVVAMIATTAFILLVVSNERSCRAAGAPLPLRCAYGVAG